MSSKKRGDAKISYDSSQSSVYNAVAIRCKIECFYDIMRDGLVVVRQKRLFAD